MLAASRRKTGPQVRAEPQINVSLLGHFAYPARPRRQDGGPLSSCCCVVISLSKWQSEKIQKHTHTHKRKKHQHNSFEVKLTAETSLEHQATVELSINLSATKKDVVTVYMALHSHKILGAGAPLLVPTEPKEAMRGEKRCQTAPETNQARAQCGKQASV